MRRLEDKIALITGANRGIGRGIAEAFAAEGAALTLMARDTALLNETAEALKQSGADVLAIPADVTDEKQVQEVFRQAMDRFGRLDILVNNAGTFAGYGAIDKVSVEAWDQIIAVNLRGPFLCTREAFRIMKQQRDGRIINIGSAPYCVPPLRGFLFCRLGGLTRGTPGRNRKANPVAVGGEVSSFWRHGLLPAPSSLFGGLQHGSHKCCSGSPSPCSSRAGFWKFAENDFEISVGFGRRLTSSAALREAPEDPPLTAAASRLRSSTRCCRSCSP